ncbi:MAG: hypothetical protein ACRC5H_06605 [Treponemataceae bacterium]
MKNISFTYEMTFNEIKELLLLLREYESKNSCAIPHSLDSFVGKIENDIYNSLTIEEAERFFA